MASELWIGKPFVKESENGVCLCAEIKERGRTYTIWYEVSARYADYLCRERSDAFVINLLLYAMEYGLDIVCEQVMSEKLYYQLVEYLIPCIAKQIDKYHMIRLETNLTKEKLSCAEAVGTSLSGGVDSFYTIFRHRNRKEFDYNMTHVTFFNAGASGDYGGEMARQKYYKRIDWIKDAAEELGLELVCVDTNVNEFLNQIHEDTHTFRTLAIVLALQKLFSKYYFSSGFEFSDFKFHKTVSYFDLLNIHCLSTETIVFYLSGGECSRIEKLDYISKETLTYQKLNVCVAEAVNCSRCEKCQRTMMGLYALDKLSLYKEVFDVEYFNRNKSWYFSNMVAYRKNRDWSGIYRDFRGKHKIRIRNYLIGNFKYICRLLYKKLPKSKAMFLKTIYNKYCRKESEKRKNGGKI